ncbi:GntR family transcriptional regulator [Fulvitalea axinellae]|uniref:GntR family transcriptional regulator n=1 Tax=Fulvitalea axinellae TaxID=1182444 RepID=A0AAU9D0G7_9BACT|nr:GntR family transcriptional regulator [Fulvitalea axinellae]
MEFQTTKGIYLQLADTIKERIISGEYKAGEKIPSVREFASKMGVNPNTIMRTFGELQSLSIIENKRGIGYFVKEDAKDSILQEKKAEFFDKIIPEFLHQARLIGITDKEISLHFAQLKNDHNED